MILASDLRQSRSAAGFPPITAARANGLLAVGGDLSPERLLVAYANGIFPWPISAKGPIPWFCPSPRTVLLPGEIRVDRSLRRAVRRARFTITFDRAFAGVIAGCAAVPRREKGTWLTPAMIRAYRRLHELGFAHSVEAWLSDRLVGGLYGVSLGSAFFGESMFTLESDASKIALFTLLGQLEASQFDFLDCQMTTPHVLRLGAVEWPQSQFQEALAEAMTKETRRGSWSSLVSSPDVGGSSSAVAPGSGTSV
ncbi:leucyl/phenylalanyl-tRNA--protein transferase, partial [Amycolatopsis sp. NPDC058278]|uniref:leucyl/phenylalanyl-tRNA--protein transferase n=1 Tax=Amycolatopsis sp. NPDC058278 TaxID=3346417 RepID=UPI0036DDC0F9